MFNCPVCNREFDAVAKLPSIGDICPRCGVRLKHKRVDKKITYLVPKDAVMQDGFTQVYIDMARPMNGAFLDPAPNPVVLRYIGDREDILINYRVRYNAIVISDGRLLCPECGGFLGTLRMITGTFAPKRCGKFMREVVDGRKGKCKKRTEFTFVNEVVAGVQIMR